jgi:hypothetical protein
MASQAMLRQIKPVNSVVEAVNRINSGSLQIVAEPGSAHKAQLRKLEAAQRGTSRAVVFGAVLVASTLLYTSGFAAPALLGYAYCAFSALWGLTRG